MTSIYAALIRGGFVVTLILLLGAGCVLPRPQVYTPRKKGVFVPPRVAVLPTGTAVNLTIRREGINPRIRGELVEVRTDGFLILDENTSLLTLVPYDLMTRMRFGIDVGISMNINRRLRVPPLKEDSVRQRALARYSRYPFGLKGTQLQQLLEALGQAELAVIGPT